MRRLKRDKGEERLFAVRRGMFLQKINGVISDRRRGVVARVRGNWGQRPVVEKELLWGEVPIEVV